jgi:hypothetical protein
VASAVQSESAFPTQGSQDRLWNSGVLVAAAVAPVT